MPMPSLKDSPPEETAQRMREIAEGLANPADAAVVRRYAAEIEAGGRIKKKQPKWPRRS
jgi:hypothetical protein